MSEPAAMRMETGSLGAADDVERWVRPEDRLEPR
jgi:hypothetical protein